MRLSLAPAGRHLGLPIFVFALFGVVLMVAGGATRPEALGQVIVRVMATSVALFALLATPSLDVRSYRTQWVFIALCTTLAVVQLVPLPPEIWTSLPGRAPFAEAASAAEIAQPWRPMNLVPDGGLNALFSLLVPFAALLMLGCIRGSDFPVLLVCLLTAVLFSAVLQVAQISGGGWSNPLVTAKGQDASGFFANRNHQALFLAIGVLLAPCWGFESDRRSYRPWAALALVVFLGMMILATGSRAGLLLGLLAAPLGVWISRRSIVPLVRHASIRAKVIVAAAGVLGLIGVAGLSAISNRALSIDRLFSASAVDDMRVRALPTVMELVSRFFPVGSGLGSFDRMFRFAEPLELLKPTYFNHAHNDYLEVALAAGLPGVLLILGFIVWFVWAISQCWAARRHLSGLRYAEAGLAVTFLILVASITDYPARTPTIMMVLVVATGWTTNFLRLRPTRV